MREVDDALRKDQAEQFFVKYGKPLLAAVIIGLSALGGFLYWQHTQKAAAEAGAEQLVLALDDLEANKAADAKAKLEQVAAGTGGTAILAQLTQAGELLGQGKANEAAKLYATVAQNTQAPQPLRDLATVREIAATFDTLPAKTVIERLSPLAQPGNPWFGVAGEMVGVAYLKDGNEKQAGPLFVKIANDKTQPDALRSRVRQLAGQIGFDALDDVVTASGEDGAPDAGTVGE